MKFRPSPKNSPSIFLSNFGTRSLTLHRNISRIKEIQKHHPSFNYNENWQLKYYIDSMIKTLEEIKIIGANNESTTNS